MDAMSIEAATSSAVLPDTASSKTPLIHPAWVRITHWVNAIAMLMMIGSGWQIYDASPLFGFELPPSIALGGWLGRPTGRFRAKLLPIRPGDVVRDLVAALRRRLSYDDLATYNAVQKLLYL